MRIPWTAAGSSGLDAALVYADVPGKHPLVVLTHGSPRKLEEYADTSPWQQLPQALWFARRGWVVLTVVRRGYGSSGGETDHVHGGRCPQTDYQQAAEYGAEDLRTAIEYARGLPMVDATRMVAAGVSTGGLATVALTAHAPAGLVAAVNFAGGRGSRADHDVCNPDDLIHAYKEFGKHSRTPQLWIYAQNDKFFWPELAQKFDEAFRSQGGRDTFVMAPPDGEDGHHLFSHIDAWSTTVDDFLKTQDLVPLPALLPEARPPDLPAPAGLSEAGLRSFHIYLERGPHKAFAVSPSAFGMAVAENSVDEARRAAMDRCEKASHAGERCSLAYVDETAVPH